jgi:hypothetical protein
MSNDPYNHGLPGSSFQYGGVEQVSQSRRQAVAMAKEFGFETNKVPTWVLQQQNRQALRVREAPNALLDFMRRSQERNRQAANQATTAPLPRIQGQKMQTLPKAFAPATNGGGAGNKNGNSATVTTPWQGSISGTTLTVKTGMVGGYTVAQTDLTISLTGIVYAWLDIPVTLSPNTNGWVPPAYVSSATITSGGTFPSDNMTTGHYYIKLIEVTNGVITMQHKSTDLGFEVNDDGSSTSKGKAFSWQT